MIRLLKRARNTLQRSIENHGALGTLRLVPRAAKGAVLRRVRRFSSKAREAGETEARFDRAAGVDTAATIELAQLQFDGQTDKESIKHGVRYQATPLEVFDALLARSGIDCSRYELVDLGSGKGRVLFMAAMHPFRRITGVEFSPELTRIAQENAGKFKAPRQACHEIVTVCADATQYAFPNTATVIYMYNPFAAPIMERVAANLERSLRENPRDVVVIYYNARCPEPLDACSRLREVASQRAQQGCDDPWVIYRSTTSN
ncbi:class I SAM-dependent methyltransferase [Sorangium sp. So ce302]|uniref:class I SAM-dependent methyltransferase n=1 Tax=Sorangium sp. So ce302 TaxID=3133297 RepID=UPI003F60317C